MKKTEVAIYVLAQVPNQQEAYNFTAEILSWFRDQTMIIKSTIENFNQRVPGCYRLNILVNSDKPMYYFLDKLGTNWRSDKNEPWNGESLAQIDRRIEDEHGQPLCIFKDDKILWIGVDTDLWPKPYIPTYETRKQGRPAAIQKP